MISAQTSIATPSASKYLQQLCKHWSHKFAVVFTPDQGRVPFGENRAATFAATPDTLTMRVEAADEETLTRLEGVVIDHLKRFSFREDLGDISWSRAA